MLALTRRVGEKILIGEKITLEIVEITGSQVRIAFNAPLDVIIVREELLFAGAAWRGKKDGKK